MRSRRSRHVLDPRRRSDGAGAPRQGPPGQADNQIAGDRDQFHDELRTHAAPLIDGGLKVERPVIRGRAADAINDLAAQIGADLIVTGSRGRGQLASMLLGSVATEVAILESCAGS